MIRQAGAAVVALLAAAPAPKPPAQALALATVLERAGALRRRAAPSVTGIVAEERYVQDAVTPAPVRRAAAHARTSRAELGSAAGQRVGERRPGSSSATCYDVDGSPVRDRSDRLTNLFLNPPPSAQQQVEAILAESARYNVGSISRTVNTPMFPLAFLRGGQPAAFQIFRTNDRLPAAAKIEVPRGSAIPAPFRPPDGAWVIRFEEIARPTVIHTMGERDLPSHGRFWIDPDTGRVLMSEIVAEDRNVRGTLTVSYQSEPVLGLLLPAAMRERYEGRRTKALVDATATYGRFRQFQVNVDETFFLKKK